MLFSQPQTRPVKPHWSRTFWSALFITCLTAFGTAFGARHYLLSWEGVLSLLCSLAAPMGLLRAAQTKTPEAYLKVYQWCIDITIVAGLVGLFKLQ